MAWAIWSGPRRTTDTIVAFSGRDGSFLWSHQIGADGAVHPGPAAVGSAGSNPGTARRCIIQFLTPVPDADRDGIADLAATVIFYETDDEMQRRLPRDAAQSLSAGAPVADHALGSIGQTALAVSAR